MTHPFRIAMTVLLLGITLAVVALPSASPAASRKATADRTVELPILKRPLQKGEVISESDLVIVETSARRLQRSALTELDSLVGKAARRYLPAGRAILARDVATPLAVRKGDLVAIVYTTPFMTLTARGRVLEDAAAGESVRTLNAHSKRTVEALAIAPGIVATRPITHQELAEALK